jgi:phosphoribosylformylglycinamidine synthase
MRVFRCYTEKRPGFDTEAQGLLHDLQTYLGLKAIKGIRLFNRYDTEGITDEIYAAARKTVFSEPQVDDCFDETLPVFDGAHWLLAIEALPGQYDQRADSCAQCIQILTCQDRPVVRAAKVYAFFGRISESDKARLRDYLINPVETREAADDKPITLRQELPAPAPDSAVSGFAHAAASELEAIHQAYGLAMDMDDLRYLQAYFRDTEQRDPTKTEIRLIDTYWSDHCRHTTFLTRLEAVHIDDPEVADAYSRYLKLRRELYGEAADTRPQTLMDIATIAAKALRRRGLLHNIDLSEEVNACSIHVDAQVTRENGDHTADTVTEDWLLMFKNETHNHPTEIEPYGGAATCIGGAIRDPLSGRSYVYQAMRVTGAGDPRVPLSETLPGKLPQRKLTVTAAQGYSSYGNQIGLATGLVHEIYHPGYVAKRMEVGAVVGAVRADNVVRVQPAPGDKVILLGGRTGRDGIGGATGSSKTHNDASLVTMASEVQKGNAPEERKIQRLFLDPDVTRMVKRCNDFGAGGVSVAVGELADGLRIDLSLVRKKYEGLDATEIAISESQERMAVVVDAADVDAFIQKAAGENLEAYVVAEVTQDPRLVMRYGDAVVADLSREFLSSNGAVKVTSAEVPVLPAQAAAPVPASLKDRLRGLVGDLRYCSQRGLVERFDSSIGAGSVLAPFGGKTQKTPAQAMAALLPVLDGTTTTCSVMSFGFDPYLTAQNSYAGAKAAVVTSVAKLVAAGCDPDTAYLSFQEYFERLRKEPRRWGKPLAALLGALDAQLDLEVAAIGGKDSMSGSFNELDVPPTLISFAIAPGDARQVISPEFKTAGNSVVLFSAGSSLKETKNTWKTVRSLIARGVIVSAWAVTDGGPAEGLFKMTLGNRLGFEAAPDIDENTLFAAPAGTIIAEVTGPADGSLPLGRVIPEYRFSAFQQTVPLDELEAVWEESLEGVFPTKAAPAVSIQKVSYTGPASTVSGRGFGTPRAVITAFPGTNCELDTARAVKRAGGVPEIRLIRNLTPVFLEESVEAVAAAIAQSQIIIIPGGFSGGDEPDGSAKFITAFFRNPRIKDAVHDLLFRRDGLMLGICNGFQALVKLGLVPYGEILDPDDTHPTLTYNIIGRHQSKYVHTRVASVLSPWLSLSTAGDVHTLPVSHGEGRFVASDGVLASLIKGGQIATQYCDASGSLGAGTDIIPNGSVMAIEGITSPDGRIFGKMCHTERSGKYIAKNICGDKQQPLFESGIKYFM